jgi:heme/copper-type cytochrome/quinol oxidase subunit 2
MSVLDLLITIIIVTILVTIALGVMTYIAYKLRLARRPPQEAEQEDDTRYFMVHEPPGKPSSPAEGVDVPEA